MISYPTIGNMSHTKIIGTIHNDQLSYHRQYESHHTKTCLTGTAHPYFGMTPTFNVYSQQSQILQILSGLSGVPVHIKYAHRHQTNET